MNKPFPPPLRPGSQRPEFVVDPRNGGRLIDPTVFNNGVAFPSANTTVGRAPVTGFIRVGRVVKALPLKDGPRLLQAPVLVHDDRVSYLADPDGNVIGVPGIWCARCLDARWVEDTRRIAG